MWEQNDGHRRWRALGMLALLLALAAWAYGPLLVPGFAGRDLELLSGLARSGLAGGAERPAPGEAWRVAGVEERPLAALSLALSARLWAGGEPWSGAAAPWLRLENLALLLLAAWGVQLALRRSLQPWTGDDHARAAGRLAAFLFVLHPLCASSVARLSSRGDLLGAAVAAWSLAAFVAGRQERRSALVALAGLGTIVAALASELVVYLPPAMALVEYASARRHRSAATRRRTATTTLVVFGACALLERLVRWLVAGSTVLSASEAARPIGLATSEPAGFFRAFAYSVEKLGLLVLPVNTSGINGVAGYAVAGLFALFALQPAFLAARSAPRLWGHILVGWLLAIVAAVAFHAGVRVPPGELDRGDVLLVASLVMAVGFATSCTAISGLRRGLAPYLLALGYAVLAHGAARPWRVAIGELEALHAAVLEQVAARGWSERIAVAGADERIAGLDALGPAVPFLLEPPFLPPRVPRSPGSQPVRPLALSLAALRAWTREPEFAAQREAGLVVVLRAAELGSGEDDRPSWVAVPLGEARPTEGRPFWRSEGRSPAGLVLESLEARAVLVSALPGASAAEAPRMRWSARSELAPGGELRGVWFPGEDGPTARFHPGGEVAWLLGGRIGNVWFPGLSSIVSAQVLAAPPGLPGEVRLERIEAGWRVLVEHEDLPRPARDEVRWRLELLDLARLELVQVEIRAGRGGALLAPAEGLAERVEVLLAGGGGPVAWTLERLAGGVTVERAGGRLGPNGGSDQ